MTTETYTPSNVKDKIVSVVSSYYNVDIFAPNKKKELVFARQVTMYLLRLYTKMGVVEIGDMFGKNHATVIHARKTVEKDCLYYPLVRNQVIELEKQIEDYAGYDKIVG